MGEALARRSVESERLLQCLPRGNAIGSAMNVASTVIGAVQAFGAGATQTDDITVLAVRWNGIAQ